MSRRLTSSAGPSSPILSSDPRNGPDYEEDGGEDLVDENMMRDYRAIPELDQYAADDLAGSSEAGDMTHEQRRAAERELLKRDRADARRRGQRLPTGMISDDEDERGLKRYKAGEADEQQAAELVDAPVKLEEFKGPLREWINLERPRNEVKRRFSQFVRTFVDSREQPVYVHRIHKMCQENNQSLMVSYSDLSMSVPLLAIWVADAPQEMLQLFSEEATRLVIKEMFPQYDSVADQIHVRITDLPIIDSIRDLRQVHLNVLIKIAGVVTRRSSVFPQLKAVWYNCAKCSYLSGPYTQNGDTEVTPGRCPDCQSTGPFNVNHQQTVYRNYQKITLQESPGTVPAGRVPRQKDVILLHDLIDSCRPGEEVEITGIYTHNYDTSLNTRNGFPVFRTVVEANHVGKKQSKMDSFHITSEDKEAIIKLSKRPDVAQIIFNSVAPSIYGHENIKIAVALSMFGGQPKKLKNKHRIRGDINVLVMGDPGTGKSQFLKYVEKTAHRCVYTTGKGASAVGLTASVRLDPMTREWTLEGGALVLADEGICLIDEFDKMNDQDRTSIHEAMEQQSISVSKAGIITSLQARCAVIAAANPVGGRYDSSMSFAENVELTDAILSRFDILCVVRDTVDSVVDERLATFVIDSHCKSHPAASPTREEEEDEEKKQAQKTGETISQDLLKKYIMYAKQHSQPKLQDIDEHKISSLYAELRRESMITGGIPIAVRHIESMIRMSEAHARLHLRNYVNDEDVNMAIRVMLESFFSTQKFAVQNTLRKQFRRYLTYNRDSNQLLFFKLQELMREAQRVRRLEAGDDGRPLEVTFAEFEASAADSGISNLSAFYKSDDFKGAFSLDKKRKVILRNL